jgi:membrane-associated phospholipid phosphatase
MVSWTVIAVIAATCILMVLVERTGAKTTLNLQFKGDVKRETRWWAQYGQGACTVFVAVLVYQLDRRIGAAVATLVAAFGASVVCTLVKRSVGRVRPNRENAGKFLGPTLKHANFRESFPSSHSASAIALSAVLAALYPPAAITFWVLGIGCALLRYIMDAHWPSDVLGGIALGAACANVVIFSFKIVYH